MSDLYWCGHKAFGDCFCLSAAAHIKSKEIGAPVYVSFWESFKELASYFDNIVWIPETERKNYKTIDCGRDPLDLSYLHNGVSRFLIHMNPKDISITSIDMNVKKIQLQNMYQ